MVDEKSSSGFSPPPPSYKDTAAAPTKRQRFSVELRPGMTTIVSWKKLLKDSNKAITLLPALDPPSVDHLALEARITPAAAPLAELWPNGSMDNHGVKGAVCRAKVRKRSQDKVDEKIKKRKILSGVKTEGIARGETSSNAQLRAMQERLPSYSSQIFAPNDMLISNPLTSNQHLSTSNMTFVLSLSASSFQRPKQEKCRGSIRKVARQVGKTTDVALLKKKLKRKPESDLGGIHVNPLELPSLLPHEKESQNSHKHLPSPHHKSSLQSVCLPGF